MLSIKREFDLHTEVVKFVREKYPDAVMVPGLGEFQESGEPRMKAWQKGYTSGQPDLLLIHPSHCTGYIGFAIEFKHPWGKSFTTENQDAYLRKLRAMGVKTMVSHKFTDIVVALAHYFGSDSDSIFNFE